MKQFHNPLAPKRNRFQAKSDEIKTWVRDELDLSDDTPISIAELACHQENCPDLETVIGVMETDKPIATYRIHLSISDITRNELDEVIQEQKQAH